jgi:hypothetical protein
MNKAAAKWIVFCIAGAGFLVFAFVCCLRQTYTWVLAAAFAGCFLFSASWKKLRLLAKAGRALKAGKNAIVIDYCDKNLKESRMSVIPAGADTFYFYGFSPETNAVKAFRWERIRRATCNEKEIGKDAIVEAC